MVAIVIIFCSCWTSYLLTLKIRTTGNIIPTSWDNYFLLHQCLKVRTKTTICYPPVAIIPSPKDRKTCGHFSSPWNVAKVRLYTRWIVFSFGGWVWFVGFSNKNVTTLFFWLAVHALGKHLFFRPCCVLSCVVVVVCCCSCSCSCCCCCPWTSLLARSLAR